MKRGKAQCQTYGTKTKEPILFGGKMTLQLSECGYSALTKPLNLICSMIILINYKRAETDFCKENPEWGGFL